METLRPLSLAFASLCAAAGITSLSFADPVTLDSTSGRGVAHVRSPASLEKAPQRTGLDRPVTPSSSTRPAAPTAAATSDLAIHPHRAHPAADALYETRNATCDLHVGFTAQGIRVVTGVDNEFAMQLTGIGYGDRLQRVTDATIYARGNRVDYHRMTEDGAAFTEWYVNRDDGLEQSFTLNAPIGTRRASEPLVVQLHCSGDFSGRMTANGEAIAFASRDGAHMLRYDGLYAFDATGRELPSRMQLDGDRLALIVADFGAVYPVTVDPKVKGGGNSGNRHANVEVRDAATDGIRSDEDDGDMTPFDYSHGADKVQAYYSFIEIDMGTKGIKNPRRARFDLGANRLLARSSNYQYEGSHGDLPPGVGVDGVLLNSVQCNMWGSRAYVPDTSSPSGWKVGPNVVPEDMAIHAIAYVALNVNLIKSGNAVTWRMAFGPGGYGPIRALDAQPVKLIRASETTWTIEALDLGRGVRAALLKYVAASNTFETVDHYDLPFKMTFTKQ